MVKYLIRVGQANANVKDKVDLLSIEVFRSFLMISLSKDGNTPLHFAAEKGHLKIVEYLITEGKADINATDCVS